MIRAHGRKIHEDKFETVAVHGSFHGRTLGALSITGQEKYRRDFEPMLPGARFVHRNDLAGLEEAVTDRTAGIVLEVCRGKAVFIRYTQNFSARLARWRIVTMRCLCSTKFSAESAGLEPISPIK